MSCSSTVIAVGKVVTVAGDTVVEEAVVEAVVEETMVITVPALTIVEIRVVGELEDAIIVAADPEVDDVAIAVLVVVVRESKDATVPVVLAEP